MSGVRNNTRLDVRWWVFTIQFPYSRWHVVLCCVVACVTFGGRDGGRVEVEIIERL